jgi:acyl-CoA synthetase (AMP-forming)/AMP-acid ligase II
LPVTAPLSPLQARRFTEKFGVTVLNGYGQAEVGDVIGWTAADAKEHPEKVGAIGRPHGGVDLKVVDDAGRELGTDEIGGQRELHEQAEQERADHVDGEGAPGEGGARPPRHPAGEQVATAGARRAGEADVEEARHGC